MLLALAALAATAHAGEVYYARKTLQIRSEPGLGGEIVATVEADKQVTVVDSSGDKYWEVDVGGKKGYAYAKSLSKDKGVDVAAALQGAGEQQARLADLRPDGAIRGLTAEAEAFAKSAKVPPEVVKDLEALCGLKITAADLEAFLKAGKLGEYGGR